MDDNFYDGFYHKKNKKQKKVKDKNRIQYREQVLVYLQLEFCEIGTWWELPSSNKIVISIINDCCFDGIKVNNAAGTVYEWLKGRNLI
jgi:hypothetical protein